MKLKKFTGLLLCAALALSMVACKFTTPAVVMTVEGEDIPAGLYLMYQYQAYSSAKSKLEDKSAKVLKSEIEGVKAEDWIHNETVASAKSYVWVEKAFAEAGLTFTEEEQASIDSQLDTIWANNEALLAANGIGRENYRRFYECEAKYEKLLAEYQDGESDKITDAEAKKYMDETYSRIQTLVLPTTDADSAALPDEKLEELNALAHAVLLVGINEKDVELREIDRVTAACEIDILDLVADAGRGYNRGIGPYSVVTVTVFDIDIKPVVVIKDAVHLVVHNTSGGT